MATNLSAKIASAIRNATLGRAVTRMRNSGITGSQIASSVAAAVAGAGAGPSTISNFIARAFKDSITISNLNAFGAPAPLPPGFSRAGKLHFFGQEVPVQLYKKEGKDQLVARVKSTGQFVSGFNGWTIKGNELVWKKGEPVPQITTEIGARRLANAVNEVPEIMNIANDVIAPRVAAAFRNALGNAPPAPPRRRLVNGNSGRGTIEEIGTAHLPPRRPEGTIGNQWRWARTEAMRRRSEGASGSNGNNSGGRPPLAPAPSFEQWLPRPPGRGENNIQRQEAAMPQQGVGGVQPRRPVRRTLFPEGGQGNGGGAPISVVI